MKTGAQLETAALSVRQKRHASRRRDLRRCWQLYLMILPAITTVFIFHYIPIYGVQIAFKDFRTSLGIWGSEWVGLKHFIRFLEYPDFWRIFWNTLRINANAGQSFRRALNSAMSAEGRYSKYSL